MNLSNDGLALRFDTPDAPAPPPRVYESGEATLTIGVAPPNPGNCVDVRYRIDGGPMRTLAARESRTDYARCVQYFTAKFPSGIRGDKVEYCPIATCAGRQVPRHGAEGRMLGSFTIARPEPSADTPVATPSSALVPRFTADLQLVAQVSVRLKPPTIFGKTPHGFRIDYYVQSGMILGNAFKAEILETSADYMLVRPDGIGLIDVHATLKTDDGAMITASYTGLIEFGEDGYEKMAAGDWPDMPRLQVSPRLVTGDPRYAWMNRTYLLGVGQVDMRALLFKYDAYAVTTGVQPGAWGPR